jgi:hypothetical protein
VIQLVGRSDPHSTTTAHLPPHLPSIRTTRRLSEMEADITEGKASRYTSKDRLLDHTTEPNAAVVPMPRGLLATITPQATQREESREYVLRLQNTERASTTRSNEYLDDIIL